MIRQLSTLLILVTLLAACGGAPATQQPTAATVVQQLTVAPTPVAASVESTRMVKHKLGDVTIPANPQRIVVLDYNTVEEMVALGVKPTGVLFDVQTTLRDQLVGVEVVGNSEGQPNLEKILLLKPDLIIAWPPFVAEDTFDDLATIAPLVVLEKEGFAEWKQHLRYTADLLNKQSEAEKLLTTYEERVAALKSQLGADTVARLKVSVFRTTGEQLRIATVSSFAGSILADVGFDRPALQKVELKVNDKSQGDEITISMEELNKADGDVIFLGNWQGSADALKMIDGLKRSPLWAQLQAVRNNTVYEFDNARWLEGSVINAESILTDLARFLAPATTSVPAAFQVIEETSDYRLVKDAQGEKQVPLNPTCIVVAGSGYLDHLLALGMKPCGAAHGPGGSGFPSYLADQLQDVAYVGGTLEVNLEAVAALNPDLIIAMHPAHTEGDFRTLFDPIAPTVYLSEPWADWRQGLHEIGLLLGKAQAADAVLADFDRKLADAKERLSQTVGSEKMMFLRVLPNEIRVYGTGSPTGDLLFNRLGLTPAALVPLDEHASAISMELIPQIDAEHIFLLDQTEDNMAVLQASPLWQTVPAVAQGQVYPVDVKIWVQGEGVFAYQMLVDQVLEQFTR